MSINVNNSFVSLMKTIKVLRRSEKENWREQMISENILMTRNCHIFFVSDMINLIESFFFSSLLVSHEFTAKIITK